MGAGSIAAAIYKPDDVYFSAADGRVTTLAREEGFARALIHAALIDSRLIIPDIFFFNSPGLKDHVLSDTGLSVLEVAVEQGLVVPALRAEADTFEDIARQMATNRIVGLIAPEALRAVAKRLDDARKRGHVEWAAWPDALGESYNMLLTKILQVQEPPAFGGDTVDTDIWRLTHRLRFDAIENARTYRRSQGGTDVRRGEIITEAGRILGVLGPAEEITDLNIVLSRLSSQGPARQPWYAAADMFFEWLDELYRFNQADRMNIQPTATNARPGTISLLAQAYRRVDYGPLPKSYSNPEDLTLEEKIPTFNELSRLNARALLELRHFGRSWRDAADAFLANPSTTSQHAAEQKLEEYARQLRRSARAEVLQSMEVTTMAGLVFMVGSAGADAVMTSLGTNIPVASIVQILTGGLISTQYIVRSRRSEAIEKKLDFPRPGQIKNLQLPDPNVSP